MIKLLCTRKQFNSDVFKEGDEYPVIEYEFRKGKRRGRMKIENRRGRIEWRKFHLKDKQLFSDGFTFNIRLVPVIL